ncbi:MAG: phosphatase PAP2 family protein [Acidobacteriaceae bacterium]|nr:phosphatase PAP2 family protein [Acidobacteriaceae bacterium]MBV9778811.1 phosphatase PAP2 family protein [Acidobacteriaceae bacterium]
MTAPHTMLQFIATGDHKLMRKVNRWRAPKLVRLWALAATRAGDGWLWYLTGLFIFIFGGQNRFPAIASAGSAAAAGIGIFALTKKFSSRKRPFEIEPHCWAKLLPPDRFSFPSGHTITAFSVAISLSQFYPVLLPALLFCAVSIAISRILLGMHFLSDVIVGALIGTGLAFSSSAIFG